MSSVSSIGANASTTARGMMGLKSEDFLKIMIEELMHQDPFNPVNNKDLISQVSQIHNIETMSQLSQTLDALVMQQRLGSASRLLGSVVTGTASDGLPAWGTVNAIRIDDDDIVLELDSGQSVRLQQVQRLDAIRADDLVGKMVIGYTSAGAPAVGRVVSVDIGDGIAVLELDNGQRVSLSGAVVLDRNTAGALVGMNVTGRDQTGQLVSGRVRSVRIEAEQTYLQLETGQQIALGDLVSVG